MPTGRRAPHPLPVPLQCPLVKGVFVMLPETGQSRHSALPKQEAVTGSWGALCPAGRSVTGHTGGGLWAQGPEEEAM